MTIKNIVPSLHVFKKIDDDKNFYKVDFLCQIEILLLNM